MERWMADLSESMRTGFAENMTQFLRRREANPYEIFEFYPRPVALEDTQKRQIIRVAIAAAKVADAAGYSTYVTLAKAAVTGKFGVELFLSGDQYKMFIPMLECLKSLDIMGPNALLQLYYLSCWHLLQRRHTGALTEEFGVLHRVCPSVLIAEAYAFAPYAQYLYEAQLPPPHDELEWFNWYLGRIGKRAGWTVLVASSQTTQFPDGVSCPAFALLVKDTGATKEVR
jgi:hypothetical protein